MLDPPAVRSSRRAVAHRLLNLRGRGRATLQLQEIAESERDEADMVHDAVKL
jgi:hypothetical protein